MISSRRKLLHLHQSFSQLLYPINYHSTPLHKPIDPNSNTNPNSQNPHQKINSFRNPPTIDPNFSSNTNPNPSSQNPDQKTKSFHNPTPTHFNSHDFSSNPHHKISSFENPPPIDPNFNSNPNPCSNTQNPDQKTKSFYNPTPTHYHSHDFNPNPHQKTNSFENPSPIDPNFNTNTNPNPETENPHQNPATQFNSLDFTPETVLETLTCYNNDWKRALEFFNWAKTESGVEHTTETYNRMIDILGKFFEFDKCWDLIDEMRKGLVSPDYVTFRVMCKRYASAHLVDEAVKAFYKMGEFGLKDEVAFSILIDALCEYKHVIEAEEICLRKKVDKDLGFNVNSTKIYNIILRGWFKMGWWSKCREFWEEMDRRGVRKDLHSYSIYMNIECKRGKPWKAVAIYKMMKRKQIKLDVVAYNTVINAVGRSEGVDFALRLHSEMKELGHEPNVVTYNTIIKLLCENGRVKEAYKMLDKMQTKDCLPDVITYHSIFGYLEKPREILNLFDKMISSGVRPKMDTYVMLMRKFERWGFLRPVLEVWDKMLEQGLSPDERAYNALIDALIEKGMIDMARKYDQEMVAKELSPKPRAVLLETADEIIPKVAQV